MKHFCSCKDHSCEFNPHNKNNNEGCDGCIEKCLREGEIPACFFNAVSDQQKHLMSFTYEDFAKFVHRKKLNSNSVRFSSL